MLIKNEMTKLLSIRTVRDLSSSSHIFLFSIMKSILNNDCFLLIKIKSIRFIHYPIRALQDVLYYIFQIIEIQLVNIIKKKIRIFLIVIKKFNFITGDC